jgi:N6-adenosine-specific RNA methylase IME4
MTLELQLTEANNGERQRGLAPVSCSASRSYATIVSDPPWEYPEGFNSQPHAHDGPITHDKPLPYPSMTVEAICALPVAALAAPDCRLWLWTTSRYLPDAFDVMKAWGFRYRKTLVWHKLDGNMGGGVAPNSAEFLLVGVKGNPPIKKKLKQSVFSLAHGKRHSEKPKEWHWLIEQVDAAEPRLEMFARRKRPGWHVWGNELPNDVNLVTPNVES